MERTKQLTGGGAARFLVAFSVLLTMVGGVIPRPAAAVQQPAGRAPLELPAMALNPLDAFESGQPGYKMLEAQTVGPSALARIGGDWSDEITNDDIQATLEGSGLVEGYQFGMRLRQDPADIRSDLARDIYGSLHEFPDEASAADGLLFLTLLHTNDEEIVRIEGTGALGPNTILTRTSSGEGEDLTQLLSIAFQTGPIIAFIELLDYLGAEPTIEEVEALAIQQGKQIQEALQTGTLGLGNKVPRLKDVEFNSLFEVRRDEYFRRDGVDIPLDLEEADLFARRVERAGDATDFYALSQFIDEANTIDPSLPEQFGWGTRVYRFNDDTAASAWLAVQSDQIEAEYIGSDYTVQDLQVLSDGTTFGDENITLTYIEAGLISGPAYRVFIRVGNTVADVRLSPLGDIPLAVVESLAAVQVQCLNVTCPDAMLITDALTGQVVLEPPVAPTPTLPTGETPIASQQKTLDLAAMTLMPEDLDTLGWMGFGSSYGQTSYPDETIASIAANRSLPEVQVREMLEGAGLMRRYEHSLYRPADESDPAGEAGQLVVSYIVEYADEPGASGIWGFMEDESYDSLAGDVPLSAPIGDQSEATRQTGFDAETNAPYDQLDLTFQVGNLHAGVAVVDWEGGVVELTLVESLAQRLLERIEAGRAKGIPGLSAQVVRLAGAEVAPYADEYFLLDGESVRAYGQNGRASTVDTYVAALQGEIDGYRVQQQVTAGTDAPEDDGWFLVELTRFADVETASAWVSGTQGRVASNSDFTNQQLIAGPSYGDESVSYTLATADGTYLYRGTVMRVDAIVVSIDVAMPEEPSAAAFESLIQSQLACLQTGGCSTPISVPADL